MDGDAFVPPSMENNSLTVATLQSRAVDKTPPNVTSTAQLCREELIANTKTLTEAAGESFDCLKNVMEQWDNFYRKQQWQDLKDADASGKEAVAKLNQQVDVYSNAQVDVAKLQDQWFEAITTRNGELQALDEQYQASRDKLELEQNRLSRLKDDTCNAEKSLSTIQADILKRGAQLQQTTEKHTDLVTLIDEQQNQLASVKRSSDERVEQLNKQESDFRAREDAQKQRRADLASGIRHHSDRESQLTKREHQSLVDAYNNKRDRAILSEALDSLRHAMGLLHLDEEFPDMLQESRDVAAVVEARISGLEARLSQEQETNTSHVGTIKYWKHINNGISTEVNTLRHAVSDKEHAIQAHLQSIGERDDQIGNYVEKIDSLEQTILGIRQTNEAYSSALKISSDEVNRLGARIRELEGSLDSQCKAKDEMESRMKEDSEIQNQEIIRLRELHTTAITDAATKHNRIAQLESEGQEQELCLVQHTSSSNEKLKKMEEILKAEEQQVSKLESDKKDLEEHVIGLEESLNQTQQEVKGLQQVNDQARAQISELCNNAEKKQQEAAEWQKQSLDTNQLLVTEKNTTSRLRNERNSNQKQVRDLSTRATKDKDQVEDLLAQLSAKQQQVTDLSSQLSTEQKQILALSTQLDTERQKVEDFSSQLNTEKEQVETLSSKLGTIQQQVTHLETLQQGHMVRDEEFRKQSTQYKSLKGAFDEMKTTKQALEKERNKLCDNLQKFRDHDRNWNAIEARSREMLESQEDFIKKCESLVTKVSKDQQPIDSLETALNCLQNLVDSMLFDKEVATKIFQMLFQSQPNPSIIEDGTSVLTTVLHGTEKLFEEMAGLLDQITQGESSEAKLTNSLKASNDEVVRLKLELAEAEKARESMVVAASKDLQLSKEQYTTTVKANEELQLQLSQIDQDKRTLQVGHRTTRLELTKARSIGDEWKAESSEWKKRFQASQATLSDYTSEIAELKRLQDQLESERTNLQSDYDDIDSTLVSVERESDKLKKQHQDSQKLLADKNGEISHMMQLLASQKDRHSGEIQSLTKDLTASRRHLADLQHQYDQISGISSGRGPTVPSRNSIETNKRTTLRWSDQQEEQDASDMVTTEQDSVLNDTRQRKRTRTARATPGPSHVRTGVPGGSSSAEANDANLDEEPWIAINEFRNDTFRYGALPQALFDKVRQQMELWDSKKGPGSTTGSWTEGAKGRAKGQVKCAHHFAQHDGSNMGLGYACDKCDQRRLVCVGLLEGKVQLRPLVPSNRGAASKADMEYWVRAVQ
ncbi:MAG: hypothetical protein Q9180_000167 [Flavoplaca navasiana]